MSTENIETVEGQEEHFGYVGDTKVVSAEIVMSENGGPTEYVSVIFEGNPHPRVLHGILFQEVVSEKPLGDGSNEADMIMLFLAKKCLAAIRVYDIPCAWVNHVGTTMTNLIANKNQLATRKLWGGKLPEQALLSEIDNIVDNSPVDKR